MKKLTRGDLLSLAAYTDQRPAFRARVIAHKSHRRVAVGPNLSLCFEDRLTIQYQIQEMLRIERIFEAAAIAAELDTYNPLIPDGSNLKATTLLEFADVAVRRRRLAELVGIEHRVWLRVDGCDAVPAIANEDLERSTDEKTSAVHFMRFELTPGMIQALRNGAALSLGCDHPAYAHQATVPPTTRAALIADLD